MESKKGKESQRERDDRERAERNDRERAREQAEREQAEREQAEREQASTKDEPVEPPKKVYLPGAGSEPEVVHSPSEIGTSTDPVISAERERVAKEKAEAQERDPMPVPSEDGNAPVEEGSDDYVVEEDGDEEKADDSYAKNRVDSRSNN